MESDLQQHHHLQQFHHDHNHQNQQSQKQTNSGLTRYQSAPSSYFSSFMDRDFGDDFLNKPPSPETERIFARFLESYGGENSESNLSNNNNNNNNNNNSGMMNQSSSGLEGAMEVETKPQLQPPPPQINLPPLSNTKPGVLQGQQRNYSSASQDFYQQNLQNQNKSSELDYRMMGSTGFDRFPQTRTSATGGGGNNSNLIRHSSSPAGLFSDIKIENGYVVMKGTGDYEGGGHGIRGRDQPTFSSSGRPPVVSSTQMSPIAELGSNNNNNEGFNEVPANTFSTGFPIDHWDESSVLSENIGGIKRFRDDDRTLSGPIPSETQNVEPGIRPPPLAHHLSLPSDIATMEKLLQLHDSVPCKIRAKRGCATHPRSIAERVRRTKISERMRKLQELVPNMDKQTNTADMLDLAVDYVKELQQEVKALSDNRAKCTCSNKQPV